MFALSISSWQMGVVVAAWIAAMNIIKDKAEATIYIHPVKGEIQELSKGNYFCPSFCDVQHTHKAHKGGYKCGHLKCNHLIYDPKDYPRKEKIKVKKKKTGNSGLPLHTPPVTTH